VVLPNPEEPITCAGLQASHSFEAEDHQVLMFCAASSHMVLSWWMCSALWHTGTSQFEKLSISQGKSRPNNAWELVKKLFLRWGDIVSWLDAR